MTDSGHISQEDLTLYAMQSLPATETKTVRMHLAGCNLCAADLSEVSGDLALLALSVDQQPLPEGARQRFLDKLSPSVQQSEKARRTSAPALTVVPRRRGPSFWIPSIAAVAMAVVAVALGVQNRTLNDELRDASGLVTNLAAKASRAQQVLEVLTSPTAQRVTLTPGKAPNMPTARAAYLPDRGGLIFQASNLAALPSEKTYELWVIPVNGKAPVPAGLFVPDATGSASLVLPPVPKGITAKAFAVTVENASGSDVPTSPILLSGAASSGE
jgi:anti-sigma-K factor RskA